MISAAEYYEGQGMMDKAVMLYHKGGRVAKALEMCFEHGLFQVLADVAEDLDDSTDPALLEKAANFFMQNGLYDKAVNLLITAHRFEEAVDLIAKHKIIITEEQAERMTYAKGEVDKKVRNALLEKIADICNKQGERQMGRSFDVCISVDLFFFLFFGFGFLHFFFLGQTRLVSAGDQEVHAGWQVSAGYARPGQVWRYRQDYLFRQQVPAKGGLHHGRQLLARP